MSEHIVLERLFEDAQLPQPATPGSAGHDLRAYLRARTVRVSDGARQDERDAEDRGGEWFVELAAGQMALIPLGFRSRLPVGVEAQIRPRSGQVFKTALTVPNAPGTVDADYAEEWMVIVRNDSEAPRRIVHGERIAQAVFARYAQLRVEEGTVTRSTERAGGFGSTGAH
ncbi:MAG TPA: dUTP diphosphatase [Gemmatimonadaceae bacterium]